MNQPMLDLDELNARHEKTEENRMKIFEDILRSCHSKIKKYNNDFKKQECLFDPPVFIIGKPPYKYNDLISYLIRSLRDNGLRAEWYSHKKAIYISWKKTDMNLPQYHNQCAINNPIITESPTTSNLPTDNTSVTTNIGLPFSVFSISTPDDGKKKKKGRPPVQHLAMVEYEPGVKDLIPINLHGIK